MRLFINDKTDSAKPLYYQSLILLFLPCEKFGIDDCENSLYVTAFQKDGMNNVSIRLEVGDRIGELCASEPINSSVYAQMKNLIGRTLLKTAINMFNIVPPWGISTGVKPVKLAKMFVKKHGRDEALRILREEYMISPKKASMVVNACVFEDTLMTQMGNKPCSLYISVPFCPTKCNYCSFVSCTTPRLLSLIPDYVEKVNKELMIVSEIVKEQGLDLKSVYVGGGTPAILNEYQIELILKTVNTNFDSVSDCEFTFEAGRPDCITSEKLRVLSDFGISRISINTQTTNDSVLKSVGRSHSFSDYLNAMELASKFDFKCINTDLIAGLPGESAESFRQSVRDVVSLKPENITIHAFTLKKSSNYRISGETSYSLSEAQACDMMDFAFDYLSENLYSPYYVYRQKNTTGNLENVGFSREGYESIYNVIMMGEYHSVFGVGAGSVTKIVSRDGTRVDRIFAPKYPYEFLDESKYSAFDKQGVLNIIRER